MADESFASPHFFAEFMQFSAHEFQTMFCVHGTEERGNTLIGQRGSQQDNLASHFLIEIHLTCDGLAISFCQFCEVGRVGIFAVNDIVHPKHNCDDGRSAVDFCFIG